MKMGLLYNSEWIILFGILIFILKDAKAKLPSSLKTCPRNHPDPNQCILEALNVVKPLLASGDLGDGFHTPPLEPLFLDNIEMGRGREFQAVFSSIKAHGGSNFIVDELRTNLSSLLFDVSVTLPHIEFTGKYNLRIRILLLSINGEGDMRGSVNNARGYVRMRGRKVKHPDGNEYMKFDKLPLKIDVNNIKLHLDNLFGGDPILGEVGNTIINENTDLYLSEILPGLEKGLSKKFLSIANNILETATIDELFPPN